MRFGILFSNLLHNFSFGLLCITTGVCIPFFRETWGWSVMDTSWLIFFSSLGFFLSSLITGIIGSLFSPVKLIIFANTILIVSGFLAWEFNSPHLNFLCLLIFYFGDGILSTVLSGSMLDYYSKEKSRVVNLMHFAFTLGAILSPLWVDFILTNLEYLNKFYSKGFSLMYKIPLIFIILNAFNLYRIRKIIHKPEEIMNWSRIREFLKCPFAFFILIFSFFYVVSECGIYTFATLYIKNLGFSQTDSGFAVTLFWTGMLIGRFICSKYSSSWDEVKWIFGKIALCIVLFLVYYNSRSLYFIYGQIFLIGISLSGVFPLLTVVLSKKHPSHSSAVSGLMFVAGSGASMALPHIFGFLEIIHTTGVSGAYFDVVYILILSLVSMGMFIYFRKNNENTTHTL